MQITEVSILIFLFIGSLIGTYFLIPKIIDIAKKKKLMDVPNDRSSHADFVPRLGGFAFAACFMFGVYFLRNYGFENARISIITGITLLFVVGIKDDLVSISSMTKLIAQMIACFFIISDSSFLIKTLHGFLGIHEIHPALSFIFVLLFMLTVINAINLIDGIDGLAASISIVVLVIYGIMFLYMRQFFFLGLCVIGVGTLLGFLKYNICKKCSENGKKIFMGDTGSMILGFMIALMTIKILSNDVFVLQRLPFQPNNLPILLGIILFIPLFDLTRVFTIRIMNGQGPFSADRRHIHHVIVDYLKISHRRACFVLMTVNIGLIFLFFVLDTYFKGLILLVFLLLFIVVISFLLFYVGHPKRYIRRKIQFRRRMNMLSRSHSK